MDELAVAGGRALSCAREEAAQGQEVARVLGFRLLWESGNRNSLIA